MIEKRIGNYESVKKTKFLFIDDNKNMLDGWSLYFDNPNAIFVVCKTVEEALGAIKKNTPDVIFLDHHLAEDMSGDEGIEIVDKLKNFEGKIYSTTNDMSVASEYEKRGIENISKCDFAKIKSIMSKDIRKTDI
ncbi:MAG: hypothetical protein C0412_18645 [Flavobacterium sp.]|nr:hypothetical protein [Flavobacterium sp.]